MKLILTTIVVVFVVACGGMVSKPAVTPPQSQVQTPACEMIPSVSKTLGNPHFDIKTALTWSDLAIQPAPNGASQLARILGYWEGIYKDEALPGYEGKAIVFVKSVVPVESSMVLLDGSLIREVTPVNSERLVNDFRLTADDKLEGRYNLSDGESMAISLNLHRCSLLTSFKTLQQ